MSLPTQLTATFLNEAEELLAQVEEIVLEAEQRKDAESINRLFRVFHTIKGSGAMFGFEEIAAFTHHVETVLDQVRAGALEISRSLVDLILAAKDHIKLMLDPATAAMPDAVAGDRIVAGLNALLHPEKSAAVSAAPATGKWETVSDGEKRTMYRICFRPPAGVMASGLDPVLLLNELRGLGRCEIKTSTDSIPPLDQLQPDQCYFAWEISLITDHDVRAIKDAFIFVEDESELRIECLGAGSAQLETASVDATTPHHNHLENSHQAAANPNSMTAAVSTPSRALQSQAESPKLPTPADPRKSTAGGNASVRVPSDRLDRLVRLVGELVINQSRLTQVSTQYNLPELVAPVEEVERLVAELRDTVLGIRMMPIGATFSRFRRLVRDLSTELGKEIQLVCEGEDTELDKTVIDQLADPLMHLLRNSLDHGIETPAERQQKGKPATGTVRLTAAHEGSHVLITIVDDGKGLDAEAIRAKALEKNLIAPGDDLSEADIYKLIFQPGFSTARQVTNVSGRGVGMDVVKRQIEALRGKVEIASQPGRGTTVSLTLPLTLAIIDGLLVEIGADRFIIPMSLVSENVELTRADRARNNGRNLIALRGELVPFLRLRELFGLGEGELDLEKVVITGHAGQRVGLVVDRVLGSHQTVIQPLGRFYRQIDLVSGSTILGDGRVALILDLPGLVRLSDRQNESGTRLKTPARTHN